MPRAVEKSPFDDTKPDNANNASGKKSSGGRPPLTAQDWGPAFIEALMEGCNVADASKRAGIAASSAYRRRHTDAEFRKAWNEACDLGTRLLEQEAQRRAFHGVDEPVFQKGVQCGSIRKYSDTLLIFLLKSRNPAKYREGADESGRGNVIVNINVETVEKSEVLQLRGAPQLIEVELEDVPSVGNTLGTGGKQDCSGLPEAEAVPPE